MKSRFGIHLILMTIITSLLVSPVIAVPADSTYILSFNVNASADCALLLDDVSIAEPVATVGELRKMPDNAIVEISDAVVTGSYSDSSNSTFYIEQQDRSAGIKVVSGSQVSVANGERITLVGTTHTDTDTGEKEIILSSIGSSSAGLPLNPLGMSNRSVSMPFTGQGLATQGLLVTTCGRVTAVDNACRWFSVDDGSGLIAGGIRCNYTFSAGDISQGDYIAVTGCVGSDVDVDYSSPSLQSTVIPVIRTNSLQKITSSVSGQTSLETVDVNGRQCLLFGNAQTGLYIDANDFSLVDIKDKNQNISYVIEPGGSLFSVSFTTSPGVSHSADGKAAIGHTCNLVRDQFSGTLRLQYTSCPIGSSGRRCDVTVSITLRNNDPILHFGLEVSNFASSVVNLAHFPTLQGLGSTIPGSAANDYLLWPLGSGSKIPHPRYEGQGQSEYPSAAMTMQMMGYCDGLGTGGLYIAPEDTSFYRKALSFESMPTGQSFQWNILHYASGDGVTSGGVWRLPYSVACGPVKGDWYDIAKTHRRSLLAQGRLIPVSQRADLPNWFKNINVWYQGQDRNPASDNMATFTQKLLQIRNALGQPYGFHMYLWQKGRTHDVGYPDYFPAAPGFANAISTLRNAGVEIMPYINVEIFDTNTAMWTNENASLWASRNSAGDFNKLGWTEEARNLNMCPGTQYWQNKILSCIDTLVRDYGVTSVYLDELHVHPFWCYATNHNHAGLAGDYFADGYRTIVNRAKTECGKSDLVLTCEHVSDIYADQISGQLSWADLYPDSVPMFQSVMKDCTVEFGMQMMHDEIYNMNSFAAKIGFQLVRGRQLGWINLDQSDLLDPALSNQLNCLKSAADCRGDSQDFLLYGEYLRPPDVSASGTHQVQWSMFPMGGIDPITVTIPNVLASTYKALNGDIGIVLVNTTNSSRMLSFPVNKQDWGVQVGASYDKSQWSNGSWGSSQAITLGNSLSVSVPAYSPVVIRLHPR